MKWLIDKIGSIIGLTLLLIMFPVIALIIKLTSPGPIFYKQLRVGKGTEKCTKFFFIYKFRSMNVDADKSKEKWTVQNDTRIFRFGSFLRRTHLDELPQFFNILIGDMSLVGPRPERVSLYPYIEKNVPFYVERLYGVLPGLTGFAQVSLGPDRLIDDVREKLFFDHAYAIHLTKPWLWLKLEIWILLKTVLKVFKGEKS